MGSFLGRIGSYRHSLTPNEALVADYLAGNPEKGMVGSIQQIAEQTGVSTASVSRLAATLGYKDWKELRANLASDSNRDENPVFTDIAPSDNDETVVQKVFNCHMLSLRDTLGQLDVKALTRVVKAISKASRIVFFGSGGSGCIAKDESLRFSHLELSAEAYAEEFESMLQAARMRKGQVAFGFSNSGRSRSTVGVLREAKKSGATTVGIANFRNTALEEVSDVFFCTSFPKRGVGTASLTARIPVQGIMDAIYVLVAHHGLVASNVREVDRALESVRLPAKAKGKG